VAPPGDSYRAAQACSFVEAAAPTSCTAATAVVADSESA